MDEQSGSMGKIGQLVREPSLPRRHRLQRVAVGLLNGPRGRRRRPRLSIEERIQRDNDRRYEVELEMMRRQGFTLHFCAVCSREGPWQAWEDGWYCDDCVDAFAE